MTDSLLKICGISSTVVWGLPIFPPFAFAFCIPERTRSRIIRNSNSANTPDIWTKAFVIGSIYPLVQSTFMLPTMLSCSFLFLIISIISQSCFRQTMLHFVQTEFQTNPLLLFRQKPLKISWFSMVFSFVLRTVFMSISDWIFWHRERTYGRWSFCCWFIIHIFYFRTWLTFVFYCSVDI